jgi:hypothetical protein
MAFLLVPKGIELQSSNVSASTLDEYDNGSSYAEGDEVKVSYEDDGTTERRPIEKYESLADSNSGNYPPDSPSKWSYLGPTNRWAMFDDYINTQTENTDSIEVKVFANKCSHFALFNLDATEIEWWLRDSSDTIVKSGTIDLTLDTPIWDVTHKIDIKQAVGAWVYNGSIEVHINNTGSTAKCGHIVIGRSQYIGASRFGAETDQLDFSRYDTADSGYTYLKQGNWAKDNRLEYQINTDKSDRVFRYVADARSVPSVWEGNNSTDFEALLVFGYYRKSRFILNYKMSKLIQDIRGMI